MKFIQEHINEKFEEDSDPIEDLNIGLHKFWEEKFSEIASTQPMYTYTKYIGNNYKYNSKDVHLVYILWDTLLYLTQKIDPQDAFNKACSYRNFDVSKDDRKKVAKALKKHFFAEVDPLSGLNEKFEQDSDPIQDLGIGIFQHRTFETTDEMYDFLSEILPAILNTDSIPNDILNDPDYRGFFLHQKYADKIMKYSEKYLVSKENRSKGIYADDFRIFLQRKYPNLPRDKWRIELKPFNEMLNEKFKEDSDPIQDLGIGGLQKIILSKLKNIFHDNIQNEDYEDDEELRMFEIELWNLGCIIGIISSERRDTKILRYLNDAFREQELFKFFNRIQKWDVKHKSYGQNFVYIYLKDKYVPLLHTTTSITINRSNLNEAFTQDSDPIEDLGIGPQKIKFREERKKFFIDNNEKNYYQISPWLDYLETFNNKIIEGYFSNKYTHIVYKKIKIYDIESLDFGKQLYIIDDESGEKYEIIPGETYYVYKQ